MSANRLLPPLMLHAAWTNSSKTQMCVDHPLVAQSPLSVFQGNMPTAKEAFKLNQLFERQTQLAEEALKHKDYRLYLWMIAQHHRFDALRSIERLLDKEELWHLRGVVWASYRLRNPKKWAQILEADDPLAHLFMSPEDRGTLEAMEDDLTVYFGFAGNKIPRTFSYTLNPAIADRHAHEAEKVARRSKGGQGRVVAYDITKEMVFAYMSGRGEQEIVLRPEFA